jgi:glutamyl-tRNA synthetase
MGYLPEALLNALARLGWSYGDEEKFSVQDLLDKFSLDHIGRSAGVFNAEKLLDLNGQYIREADTAVLVEKWLPFLRDMGFDDLERETVVKAAETLKPRAGTLQEMAEGARFYFTDEIVYEDKADRKFLKPGILEHLEDITSRLEQCEPFTLQALEDLFRTFLDERAVKLGKIAQPIRVALTGKTASPGLFEVMEVLGREKTVWRLKKALTHIRSKPAPQS